MDQSLRRGTPHQREDRHINKAAKKERASQVPMAALGLVELH